MLLWRNPTPNLLAHKPSFFLGICFFAAIMCMNSFIYTHDMRTNILIDDDLMEAAMLATGVRSKKETVELGLQTLVRLYRQQGIRDFKGKLQWDGDLDEMRID
jgi:Arc/MetJ family transcription regulator